MKRQVETVRLNLPVGQLPVTVNYRDGQPDLLWMHQKQPDFGAEYEPEQLAVVLNIPPANFDTRFPIQDVSTGLPFIIVPLVSRKAVQQCRPGLDAYNELIENSRAKAVLVFCDEPENPQNQLKVRMFAPYYNVPEDAATGSANGCLTGYLVRHNYFNSAEIKLRVEQGDEIGRPSLLYLYGRARSGAIEVVVGGRVIKVAQGELL